MNPMRTDWDSHYKKEKSLLSYPDENLVRLVAAELRRSGDTSALRAIDIGCGSGRHILYLRNAGIGHVYGSDYSLNAMMMCTGLDTDGLVNCDNRQLPFAGNTFDISVAWGSLHYSSKEDTRVMVSEIKRIMKEGGMLFATLRRDNDTYLKSGTHLGNNTWRTGLDDLTGTVVSFYSEPELKDIFSGFRELKYGWMERTIIGDTGKVISHWIISAAK